MTLDTTLLGILLATALWVGIVAVVVRAI